MREMMTRSQQQQQEMSWAERIPEQQGIWGMMGDIYGAVKGYAMDALTGGMMGLGRGLARRSGGGGPRGYTPPPPEFSPEQSAAWDKLIAGETLTGDEAALFGGLSADQMSELGLVQGDDGLTMPRPDQETLMQEAIERSGRYRPARGIQSGDVTDTAINTIAFEAVHGNVESIDAVINVMLNRLGSPDYSGKNITEVATARGQFEAYSKWVAGGRTTDAKNYELVKERLLLALDGRIPDNTNGANEFRAANYAYGSSSTFNKQARASGFFQPAGPKGNVFVDTGTYRHGKYAAYSERLPELTREEIMAMPPKQQQELFGQTWSQMTADKRKQAVAWIGTVGGINLASIKALSEDQHVLQRQHKVAGIRRGQISKQLETSLNYAAEQASPEGKRIIIDVTSGGQRMHGARGATGSHRHDQGGAADFNAYLVDLETGKRELLDIRKPGHATIINNLTASFARVHPEAGVGANYMSDPTKIHFGGPNKPGGGALAYLGPRDFKRAHGVGVGQRQADIAAGFDPLAEWQEEKRVARKDAETQVASAEPYRLSPAEDTATDAETGVDLRRKKPIQSDFGNFGLNLETGYRALGPGWNAYDPNTGMGVTVSTGIPEALSGEAAQTKAEIAADIARPAPEIEPIPEGDLFANDPEMKAMQDEALRLRDNPTEGPQLPSSAAEEQERVAEAVGDVSPVEVVQPNVEATLSPNLRTELTPGTIEEGPLQQTPIDETSKEVSNERPSETQTGDGKGSTQPATNKQTGSGTNFNDPNIFGGSKPGHRAGSGSGMGCHYCDA
jgi:hypothetical protein